MRHVPALDGIRALAVTMVLCFHANVPGLGAGFFGVDVFFVLSGYLITQVLVAEHERTGRLDVPTFYVRRLRRLWPALLLMLAVYLAAAPLLYPEYDAGRHAGDALIAAIYMADYAKALDMPAAVLRHMWSLSVEEHFYLLWPVVLLCVLKLPRRAALLAVAGLFVGATAWRAANIPAVGWGVYHRFDTHASGLFLGCLLGLMRAKLPERFFWLGALTMLVACLFSHHKGTWTMRYGFTLAEVGAGLVVMAQPKWLGHPVLTWLGRLSYGIYLWHYLFRRVALDAGLAWEGVLAVSVLGGTACAALSYYTVEGRFRPRPAVDAPDAVADAAPVRP